ncbi:hypothetical protein [Pyrococcus kukulkanii]|uniref:Uncharacterized protein n=1 Tax=Pyrococcus kukulkanii TaxID=1609559 RepID=A0ABV4T8T1_9EURY
MNIIQAISYIFGVKEKEVEEILDLLEKKTYKDKTYLDFQRETIEEILKKYTGNKKWAALTILNTFLAYAKAKEITSPEYAQAIVKLIIANPAIEEIKENKAIINVEKFKEIYEVSPEALEKAAEKVEEIGRKYDSLQESIPALKNEDNMTKMVAVVKSVYITRLIYSKAGKTRSGDEDAGRVSL